MFVTPSTSLQDRSIELQQTRYVVTVAETNSGFYLTLDRETGDVYGMVRAGQRGSMGHTPAFDIDVHRLGDMVDIRAGGNSAEECVRSGERARWTARGLVSPGV